MDWTCSRRLRILRAKHKQKEWIIWRIREAKVLRLPRGSEVEETRKAPSLWHTSAAVLSACVGQPAFGEKNDDALSSTALWLVFRG